MRRLRLFLKLMVLSFVFVMLFTNTYATSATSTGKISLITIEAYIDSNGDAQITETWSMSSISNTGGYKVLYDLDEYNITDFSVTDSLGNVYENVGEWDTNSDDKTYKCGTVYDSDTQSIELYWGTTGNGTSKYILTYTIENFVEQYNDSQGVDYTFISDIMYDEVDRVGIAIHTDIELTENNTVAYYLSSNSDSGAITYYQNEYIILDSETTFSSGEYIGALLKFEDGIFDTDNIVDASFDEIYSAKSSDVVAGIGTIDTEESSTQVSDVSTLTIIKNIATIAAAMLFLIIISPYNIYIGIAILIFALIYSTIKRRRRTLGEMPKYENAKYYKDIPCNYNMYEMYWIMRQYMGQISTNKSDFFSALIVKWIKEKKVTLTSTNEGMFSYESNQFAIDVSNLNVDELDQIESEFAKIVIQAAGSNKKLEAFEIEDWCAESSDEIDIIFNDLVTGVNNELKNSGYIQVVKDKRGKAQIVYTDEIRQEAIKILGLEKYLNNFEKVYDGDYVETKQWNYYLIISVLLGTESRIKEQFKHVENRITTLNPYIDVNNDMDIVLACATRLRSSMKNGINRYQKAKDGYITEEYSNGGASIRIKRRF